MIIDAHCHLWKKQNGIVDGKPVYATENGKSQFGDNIRQMMPPYMLNGENNADMLIANMDYAGVAGAVVTQEYIDGNQDAYLKEAKGKFTNRLKICALYNQDESYVLNGFDGLKMPAQRFDTKDLTIYMPVFKKLENSGKFLSIDLMNGDAQTASMREVISECPKLKIAIGHFAMVTHGNWLEQINLAKNENVFIESGGLTWLFNYEFYPYLAGVRAIKEAAQICGYEKLMWGSDYPRTMVEITYKMSFDFVLKSNELTQDEKALFLGINAQNFYEFDNLPKLDEIKNML